VRGRGLFAGVELHRDMVAAGVVARRLLQVGMLTEDTHRTTIRFAPPLIISESQVDGAVDRLTKVLEEVASPPVLAEHEKPPSRAQRRSHNCLVPEGGQL